MAAKEPKPPKAPRIPATRAQALERIGITLGIAGLAGLDFGCALVSVILAIFVGSAFLAGVGVIIIAVAARTPAPVKEAKQ